jgi:hypothetical protein
LVRGNPDGPETPAARGGQGRNAVSAGNDHRSRTESGSSETPRLKEKSAGTTGPVAPAEDAPRKLLRWLGVIAGVLAILTFLGIANYQQLASALGWHSGSTSSPARDSADSGVCTSAQADLAKINADAPAGIQAKSGFYNDQATAFYTLFKSTKNSVLGDYMVKVQADLTGLSLYWGGVAAFGENEQQNIAKTTASLSQNEKTLESWCLAHTGVS